jgi:hypothetical protein
MSDTVSATQFWTLGDVRMNFLAPAGTSPQPDVGSPHIAGGANSTYASPSLIVNFATAVADFQPPAVAAPPDPAPPTVSAYAAGGTDSLQPVVIVGALHTS